MGARYFQLNFIICSIRTLAITVLNTVKMQTINNVLTINTKNPNTG